MNTLQFKNLWIFSENQPMIFTRPGFWIFLTFVLLVYSLLYRKLSLRHAWLFLASLFFYYKTGGIFFILLLISIITDYIAGIRIASTQRPTIRKIWVAVSLVVNLSLLFYFKYTFFFLGLIRDATGLDIPQVNYLAVLGNQWFHTRFNISGIILPVGISFYTFQTLSYTLDVYRQKVGPVRRFTDFAFYVSFFPQLVAGPIVRAAQFIPQLSKKFRLSRDEFGHALYLILLGLFKKMVIADMLARLVVDKVFDQPAAYTAIENLMAWYGYGLQIFCDFSGYTDIAIGVSLLFGFRIPANFHAPYQAVSLTDFWHRWHISLSSWLRDYLYIPLGGNRKGRVRGWINILVTMILGGLWHGANLRFLFWGMAHGLVLVVEKIVFRIFPGLQNPKKIGRWVMQFCTFHVVTFLWVFFRAPDMQTVQSMIRSTLHHWGKINYPELFEYYGLTLALLALGYAVHWLPAQWQENARGMFVKTPLALKFLITCIMAWLFIQVSVAGYRPFIYFRF